MIIASCLGLVGCWGPYLDPDRFEVRAPRTEDPVHEVVVPYFGLEYFTRTGATSRSTDFATNTQTLTVATLVQSQGDDVTLDLVDILNARGVRAVARTKATVETLEPGQLLLVGRVCAYDTKMGPSFWAQMFLLTAPTLGLWGAALPWPYPAAGGVKVLTSAIAVDDDGDYVLSDRQDVFAYIRSLNALIPDSNDTFRECASEAFVRYAEALADRLRSVMTDGELPARPRAERGAGGDAPPPAADVATPPAGEAEPARSPPPSDAAPRR